MSLFRKFAGSIILSCLLASPFVLTWIQFGPEEALMLFGGLVILISLYALGLYLLIWSD